MMIKRGLVISGFLICFMLSMISVSAIEEGSEFVQDLSEGKTRTFYPGDVLGFNILGGRHTFLLASIKGDVINVKLAEPVITASMAVGEEKRFDFNKDEVYDVYVKIHSVMPSGITNVANVTVQAIAEPVGSVSTPAEPEVVEEPEENVSEEVDKPVVVENEGDNTEEESDGTSTWIVIGVIVAVIAALVVYFVLKKK